jgi:predicted nucleic acid-binding protein
LESEAIITIIKHLENREWTWISSSVVLFEVNQILNSDRKQRIIRLCDKATTVIKLNEEIYLSSEQIKELGFKSYDALHLACAKYAKVEVFLSTDDKLVKKAHKNQAMLQMKVDNPLNWLQEVL